MHHHRLRDECVGFCRTAFGQLWRDIGNSVQGVTRESGRSKRNKTILSYPRGTQLTTEGSPSFTTGALLIARVALGIHLRNNFACILHLGLSRWSQGRTPMRMEMCSCLCIQVFPSLYSYRLLCWKTRLALCSDVHGLGRFHFPVNIVDLCVFCSHASIQSSRAEHCVYWILVGDIRGEHVAKVHITYWTRRTKTELPDHLWSALPSLHWHSRR